MMTNTKILPILLFLIFLGSNTLLKATELVKMCNNKPEPQGISSNPSNVDCNPEEGITFYGGEACDNEFLLYLRVANLSGYDNPPNQNSYSLPSTMPDFYVHFDSDFDGNYDTYLGPFNEFSYKDKEVEGSNGGTHYIFEHEINLMEYMVPLDPCEGILPPHYSGELRARLVEIDRVSQRVSLYDIDSHSDQWGIISCEVFHEVCFDCSTPGSDCTGNSDPVYSVNICTDCESKCTFNTGGSALVGNNNSELNSSNQKNIITPNPFQNQVTIEFESNNKERISIQVFNMNGANVFEKDLIGIDGKMKEVLNLNDLPAGVYYCRLSVGNNHQTSKLVKL